MRALRYASLSEKQYERSKESLFAVSSVDKGKCPLIIRPPRFAIDIENMFTVRF